MAARTSTVKRKTAGRTTVTAKRRRTAVSSRRAKSPSRLANTLVPLVFIAAIFSCLVFLFLMGYRTVTASSFFDVKAIDVRGNLRVSKDDIEKIVRREAERNGVWNAELEEIKAGIEKFAYVKTAVVSRVLPSGIQVRIVERMPRATVRLSTGDVWVDDEATVLGAVGKNDARSWFVLRGWNEAKSEKAQKDNQERVRLFVKIQNEWQNAGIANRVTVLNLSDLQDAQATVEDSGETVTVSLGKEEFSRRLQKALEVIEGKGQSIESLISHGSNVVAKYRNS